MISDDNSKQINCPLGKIEELYPGKDRKFHVAKIKTNTGSFLRPHKRLYPLEINNELIRSFYSR